MFTTDQQCLQYVADALQIGDGVSGLATFWSTIVSRSHSRAYTELVMRLLARGYTLDQVNTWGADAFGAGAAFELDLTLFYSLTSGQSLAQVDLTQVAALYDRRKELAGDPKTGEGAIQLIIGGVFQYPGSTPGTVGTGGYDTSQDRFVLGLMPDVVSDPDEGTRF